VPVQISHQNPSLIKEKPKKFSPEGLQSLLFDRHLADSMKELDGPLSSSNDLFV